MAVTSVFQTKIGIRRKVIPGARRFRMVIRKFSAEMTDETPRKSRPRSQKSVWGPTENGFSVRVA